MSDGPTILFTVFEHSGDMLAAQVVSSLLVRYPSAQVYAFGGPRVRDAGAQLIGEADMGRSIVGFGKGLAEVGDHYRRMAVIRRWLRQHDIDVLVPVDSPGNNWSVCRLVRLIQPNAKIVHLVLPQVWAWATWRIRKLKRLTDHVLCLLPFETDFLSQHGIDGTFVGHPVFSSADSASAPATDDAETAPPELPCTTVGADQTDGVEPCAMQDMCTAVGACLFDSVDGAPDAPTCHDEPAGHDSQTGPKLALLPGSREGEIKRQWPIMLDVYRRLRQRHDDMWGLVAAVDEDAAVQIRGITGEPWPDMLGMAVHQTPDVLRWADVVFVVSGTATLETAMHRKPMAALYAYPRIPAVVFGRLVMHTNVFTLPNLVAKHAGAQPFVPEFIPHYGSNVPIIDAIDGLITDQGMRDRQVRAMNAVAAQFEDVEFADKASSKLVELLGADA